MTIVTTDAVTETTLTKTGMTIDTVTETIAVTGIFALTRQCITIENADVKETAIMTKTGAVNAAATAAVTAEETETGIDNDPTGFRPG